MQTSDADLGLRVPGGDPNDESFSVEINRVNLVQQLNQLMGPAGEAAALLQEAFVSDDLSEQQKSVFIRSCLSMIELAREPTVQPPPQISPQLLAAAFVLQETHGTKFAEALLEDNGLPTVRAKAILADRPPPPAMSAVAQIIIPVEAAAGEQSHIESNHRPNASSSSPEYGSFDC